MGGRNAVLRLEWSLWGLVLFANFVVAASFFVGGFGWHYAYYPNRSAGDLLVPTGLAGVLYFAVASAHARLRVHQVVGPAVRFIAEDLPSTARERVSLAKVPRRLAVNAAAYWLLAPAWGIPLVLFGIDYDFGALLLAKVVIAWVMLAVAAVMLTYLLVERGLRRARAEAFVGETMLAGQRTMGMLSRLLLAWLAAAGLPLGTMALFMVGTDAGQRIRSAGVIWSTAGIGAAAGIVVMIYAARAIVDPVNRVRTGLRTVAEGDLSIDVHVDESGELGLLQAGFNQMVVGLRERDHMRELFGAHVGADVAARALDGQHGLGGERREASAMFVDIIASTGLAQRTDPDEVVALLNAFFEAVVIIVGVEGGLINKFQGDGALCVFGAPIDQPDHASRALRVARQLHRRLGSLPHVTAAIGVSSGEVVAGNVGAADRYEYTVIGDAVNEAARLTEQAKLTDGRILVSASTLRLAQEEAAHWCEAGSYELRGRAQPTVAYALVR